MAWLFACFGYSKKRKRLKSSHKIHSQDKGIGSYQALELPSSCLPEDSEGGNPKPICSNLKCRKQCKPKNRKVRFDLNVIAYEPVQAYDDGDDDHDDDLTSILAAQREEQEEKEEDDIIDFLANRQNSTGVKRERSCSFTYRYNNCYDEEDELESEIEDDLDEVEEKEDEEAAEEELEMGQCVNPVLIPIENLNQWRAIKKKRWEIVA